MKVVYKQTLTERMDQAVIEAARIGKEIKYFELNREEWLEFKRLAHSLALTNNLLEYTISLRVGKYRGIDVVEGDV